MELQYSLQKRAVRYAILHLENEIYGIKRHIEITKGTDTYNILRQNLIQYESDLKLLQELEESEEQ